MAERPSGRTATLLASAARTATVSSAAVTGDNHRGAHVIVTATAKTSTPSVVPTIEGYNEVTDAWYTILTGAAITDAAVVVLKVYPGITVASNLSVSDVLPARWRVTMTAGDADSLTYSVVANLIK